MTGTSAHPQTGSFSTAALGDLEHFAGNANRSDKLSCDGSRLSD